MAGLLQRVKTTSKAMKRSPVRILRGEPIANFCETPASSSRPQYVAVLKFGHATLTNAREGNWVLLRAMNTFDSGLARKQFPNKLLDYELLYRYLAPSLTKRLQGDEWYENRIIRYVLRDSTWLRDLENTFGEAQLDAIPNSEDIFNVLQRTELDYDEQLFDALAEVRLARWAHARGLRRVWR